MISEVLFVAVVTLYGASCFFAGVLVGRYAIPWVVDHIIRGPRGR